MIENMNKDFVDFWFTNSLQDCGEINNNNIVNLNDIKIYEDNIIKKLNYNYSELNTNNSNESYSATSDSIINESDYTTQICDNTKSRTSQTNRRKNTNDRNEPITETSNYNSKKYINIQQNTSRTIKTSKRELLSVQQKSRIYERRSRKKKILLDSFTKPSLDYG
jgi:hypothetical protein